MYYDYRYKFLTAGTGQPAAALTALRDVGLLPTVDANGSPTAGFNALGLPMDETGAINADKHTWRGSPGRGAFSYTDPSGATVNVAAAGDPTYTYLDIRSTIDPTTITVNTTTSGLEACTATEAATVLGVWA